MAAPIHVPPGFRDDFDLVCQFHEYSAREIHETRNAIRENFETMGPWVQATAKVIRFCKETWGKMPTAELCRGYLASKGVFPADDAIFKRWGILLLATLCAEAAGVFSGDDAAAEPRTLPESVE